LRGVARLCRFAPAGFWLLALACIAALGSTLEVHAREFRTADIQGEDHTAVQAIGHMGRSVTERTGGRHTLEVTASPPPEKDPPQPIAAQGRADPAYHPDRRSNVGDAPTLLPSQNLIGRAKYTEPDDD
jgi:hypothetical protein